MKNNRRKFFFVNPSFQIRFCFYITILVFVSSLFYPVFIYNTLGGLFEKIPQEKSAIEEARQHLLVLLSVIQLVYIIIIFIFTIFVGHRIAGPLFKLKNFLISIRSGKQPEVLKFRKEDYFQDLANEVNVTFRELFSKRSQNFTTLSEAILKIESLKQDFAATEHHRIDKIIRQIEMVQSEQRS